MFYVVYSDADGFYNEFTTFTDRTKAMKVKRYMENAPYNTYTWEVEEHEDDYEEQVDLEDWLEHTENF